ncbi:MAG: clan AA aspartic protease [Armatimonadetes bacterium]|nr:clan AA aspartic protease [Armatimonadota bacterium]
MVDTGFNGDLTFPSRAIQRLNAVLYDTQTHLIANGSEVPSPVYQAEIEWLDETRTVEILVLDGNPLLGTGLLAGCNANIEAVEGGEIVIELL